MSFPSHCFSSTSNPTMSRKIKTKTKDPHFITVSGLSTSEALKTKRYLKCFYLTSSMQHSKTKTELLPLNFPFYKIQERCSVFSRSTHIRSHLKLLSKGMSQWFPAILGNHLILTLRRIVRFTLKRQKQEKRKKRRLKTLSLLTRQVGSPNIIRSMSMSNSDQLMLIWLK